MFIELREAFKTSDGKIWYSQTLAEMHCTLHGLASKFETIWVLDKSQFI